MHISTQFIFEHINLLR